AATLLTDVRNPGALATPLVAAGDVLTLKGAKQGGRDLPASTFTVTATTTVNDLLTFFNNRIGINTDPGVAGSPGVSVNGGMLQINGNAGVENELEIAPGSLTSSNSSVQNPFAFTRTQTADGESVHTSFQVYDSIGTPIQVDLVGVLEARTTNQSTWRFYATSKDNTGASINLGESTVSFDGQGRPALPLSNNLLINRAGTGANDPLAVKLDLSHLNGLAVNNSSLVMTFQDGFSAGTLVDYSVGGDGIITGTFSNGL